jgi:hypothetical protein
MRDLETIDPVDELLDERADPSKITDLKRVHQSMRVHQ